MDDTTFLSISLTIGACIMLVGLIVIGVTVGRFLAGPGLNRTWEGFGSRDQAGLLSLLKSWNVRAVVTTPGRWESEAVLGLPPTMSDFAFMAIISVVTVGDVAAVWFVVGRLLG